MSYMKPNELKDYEIMCKVKGTLPYREHEDGMLNDALLEAYDNADFGCLTDTDLTDELWEIEGKCVFTVTAHSESEALEKAEGVFFGLCDKGKLDFGDITDCYCDWTDDTKDCICLNEFPHIEFDKSLMYSDNTLNNPLTFVDIKSDGLTDRYLYTTQIGTISGTGEENNGVYFDWSLLYDKESKTITFAPAQSESRCFSPAYPKGFLNIVPNEIIQYAYELSFKDLAKHKNFDLNRWEKTANGYAGKYLSVTIDLTDEDLQKLGVKELVDSCECKDKCREIARNAIRNCIEEYEKAEKGERRQDYGR